MFRNASRMFKMKRTDFAASPSSERRCVCCRAGGREGPN